MNRLLLIISGMGVVAFASFCCFSIFSNAEDEADVQVSRARSRIAESTPVKTSSRVDVAGGLGTRMSPKREDRLAEERDKPTIDLEDDEFRELDDMQRAVVLQLRKALDDNDFNAVMAAVRKMRKMGEEKARIAGYGTWERHVPVAMRKAAVESMGWFGSGALPEMVEFLSDGDSEVVQMTTDQFEQAMQDPSLGDRQRSEVIKMMSSVAKDEDLVDWMCMEINNMRHSVGIETMVYMSENGSDAVREKIPETMEFFTGEETVKTYEDAEKWLQDNPDDPDDDDFYGPMVSDP